MSDELRVVRGVCPWCGAIARLVTDERDVLVTCGICHRREMLTVLEYQRLLEQQIIAETTAWARHEEMREAK
jgi:hypothetical protein